MANEKDKEVRAAGTSKFIDILAVIDTDYIKRTYGPKPNSTPNTPFDIDHNSEYMICINSRGTVKGQATADIEFQAYPGDHISFRATSADQNSDDAVILYNIQKFGGTDVFNRFVCNIVTRNRAVEPDPASINGLPPKFVTESFTSLDSVVARGGKENFQVCIAVYTTVKGQEQQLYGYYRWDPTITVNQ